MAGRKPANDDIYKLKPGKRTVALEGNRLKYRYTYARQFNRNNPELVIKVVNEGGQYFFERIKP
jgi:hypothetical protein